MRDLSWSLRIAFCNPFFYLVNDLNISASVKFFLLSKGLFLYFNCVALVFFIMYLNFLFFFGILFKSLFLLVIYWIF